jgi:hypothetical protein
VSTKTDFDGGDVKRLIHALFKVVLDTSHDVTVQVSSSSRQYVSVREQQQQQGLRGVVQQQQGKRAAAAAAAAAMGMHPTA